MNGFTSNPARSHRRAVARAARDAFPPMGVYAIRDSATGRTWVGSSRDVHARLRRIQFELRLGSPRCHPELQEAWWMDPTRLSFEVVDLVRQRPDPAFDHNEELVTLEALWRAQLKGGAA